MQRLEIWSMMSKAMLAVLLTVMMSACQVTSAKLEPHQISASISEFACTVPKIPNSISLPCRKQIEIALNQSVLKTACERRKITLRVPKQCLPEYNRMRDAAQELNDMRVPTS